jgi:hypothetical protein
MAASGVIVSRDAAPGPRASRCAGDAGLPDDRGRSFATTPRSRGVLGRALVGLSVSRACQPQVAPHARGQHSHQPAPAVPRSTTSHRCPKRPTITVAPSRSTPGLGTICARPQRTDGVRTVEMRMARTLICCPRTAVVSWEALIAATIFCHPSRSAFATRARATRARAPAPRRPRTPRPRASFCARSMTRAYGNAR